MAEAAFRDHLRAGFAGSLRIWEVGRIVLQPLLASHGRVAVLIVDAMRADLWNRLRDNVASALAGRTLRQKWAVVPEPTRTTEAVAALYLGRPVPPGAGRKGVVTAQVKMAERSPWRQRQGRPAREPGSTAQPRREVLSVERWRMPGSGIAASRA